LGELRKLKFIFAIELISATLHVFRRDLYLFPKCKWEPDGKPHWQCTCGTVWDTFSTAARCPSCGKVWEYMQCIEAASGCNAISLHLDWYEGLGETIR
jgi:hypothetical protein